MPLPYNPPHENFHTLRLPNHGKQPSQFKVGAWYMPLWMDNQGFPAQFQYPYAALENTLNGYLGDFSGRVPLKGISGLPYAQGGPLIETPSEWAHPGQYTGQLGPLSYGGALIDQQWVMDQQLLEAAAYGIDFFIFDWYWSPDFRNNATTTTTAANAAGATKLYVASSSLYWFNDSLVIPGAGSGGATLTTVVQEASSDSGGSFLIVSPGLVTGIASGVTIAKTANTILSASVTSGPNPLPCTNSALLCYLNSPYKNLVKFAILYTNDAPYGFPDTLSSWQISTNWIINHCFSDSQYMTIGGQPLLYIFDPNSLMNNASAMGQSVNYLLSDARARSVTAGYGRISFFACVENLQFWLAVAPYSSAGALHVHGYDGVTAYDYPMSYTSSNGSITVGASIHPTAFFPGTQIASQTSGTTGGIGVYALTHAASELGSPAAPVSFTTASAVFTGYTAGAILTVTAVSSGTITANAYLSTSATIALTNNTFISAFGTGSGGVGTYNVDASLPTSSLTGTGAGTSSFVGSVAAGVLTVTHVYSGSIAAGQTLSASNLSVVNMIVGTQISGATGGVGTYNVTYVQNVGSAAAPILFQGYSLFYGYITNNVLTVTSMATLSGAYDGNTYTHDNHSYIQPLTLPNQSTDQIYQTQWNYVIANSGLYLHVPMSVGCDHGPLINEADPSAYVQPNNAGEVLQHFQNAATFTRNNMIRTQGVVICYAWNENAEGAYLEPSVRNGFGYLEALKAVFG